jgi:phytoene desaturase
MNGMTEIPKAMAQVAKNLGVIFHFNENVTKINTANGEVIGLTANETFHSFDAVLAASDYQHVESKMLEKEEQSYSDKYWESRTLSPSSLLFYLGFNTKIPNLLHHNLFFDTDFKQHAKEIYDTPEWPSNPLFYACVPSKTDPSVAPENHENVFILIPAATGLTSTEKDRQKYLDIVLDRIEKRTHCNLREHLVYQRSFAHEEFISEYNSFKGNAYGLANTLMQTAFLKPKLKSKKIKNLYYAGQLTVPGPGMPPSIISGKLAANLIHESLKKAFAV